MANPYLSGNFAPVLEERSDDHELPVTGVVPPDLYGRLVRNGPNPTVLPADEDDYHWFSGDGMLHAVTLAGGRAVGYRNRWIRTRALAGKVGTLRPRGPTEPVDGPANTHVVRHAGVTMALVESGFPHAVSAGLDQARVHDFDGALASPMAAHPKVDPVTGELLFFGVDLFGPPFLRSHVVDPSGQLVRTVELDLPRATMMHDWGVTATRTVFLDLPVVFDLALATEGRSMPFRWAPEAGARVGVVERHGAGAGGTDGAAGIGRRPDGRAAGSGRSGDAVSVPWISLDPAYVFHVANAWDDGDRVVLDVVRYDAAFETAPGGPISGHVPSLARWTVDPAAGVVREEVLDDAPVEFPRIDDAVAGLPYRMLYAVVTSDRPEQPGFLELVQYDLARGTQTRYRPGDHRYPSEPVFVRAHDGHGEDEGWVLSVVYDAARGASDLVILDATAFAGPPVATVHLPARVPFGFHGSWLPDV